MLWTIAVILLILWGAGLVAGIMMGGLLHILVVLAIAAILMQKFHGRKPI
ncbi:MAG: lmo0937 family membrane protein [Candidatus Zixiibacteriota bacterium]